MNQWADVLDIKDVWDKVRNKTVSEITFDEVVSVITGVVFALKKIKVVSKTDKAQISKLIKSFSILKDKCVFPEHLNHYKTAESAVNVFNANMERLYNWGDTLINSNDIFGKKRCWISTN